MEYGVGVLCVLCVAYSVIYNINVSFYELITGILVGGEIPILMLSNSVVSA